MKYEISNFLQLALCKILKIQYWEMVTASASFLTLFNKVSIYIKKIIPYKHIIKSNKHNRQANKSYFGKIQVSTTDTGSSRVIQTSQCTKRKLYKFKIKL